MLIMPIPPAGKPTPQKVKTHEFDRSIPVMENPKD